MLTVSLNIENLIEKWTAQTFSEWVESTYWKDNAVKNALAEQLNALGIAKKPIDGFSVMGLEQSQEGSGGIGVSYTETFFETVAATGSCHPIDYLYLIVRKAIDQGYGAEKTRGILARGMRTYASLLRDHDFAYKIEREFDRIGFAKKFKVSSGSVEDSKNHTDVLVTSPDNLYRIWLFQFSKRGLPHDIERLTEQRGKLPSGVHILCPLKSEIQHELEIAAYRIKRYSEKVMTLRSYIDSAKKKTKVIEVKSLLLEKYLIKLAEQKKRETELNLQLKGNIHAFHGWYLYGQAAVSETVSAIIGIENKETKPESYANVYQMLVAPKKYLSKLSIFKI